MLDIKLMREHREHVLAGMRALGAPEEPVLQALELDERRRALVTRVEILRADRNSGSREIGQLMRSGQRAEGEARQQRMLDVGKEIQEIEVELSGVDAAFEQVMLSIPNIPHPSVPVGPDDSANIIVRQEGEPRQFDFEPQPHWDLGPALDIIDFERGIKVSGTRFYMLKGAGARLQRALISWMLDLHVEKHGYTEVYPPYMVRTAALIGTGNLPKFGDLLYRDIEEELWLVPTAEVPVTNMYREEILDGAQLPIRHVAYTACFRREKMSAGRDVRGIKRGHQFDKVEMVKFVRPETSMDELMSLIDDAEDVCRGLNIPHRIVQMCTGDLSFVAAAKYDIELWAPGVKEWLEVSSCSNFLDFQARRANIRFRPEPGGRPEFVHTLNGSGLALPRLMIGVMETYQRSDGSIEVPEVLRPYMGGMESIRRV